jgi:hypothetical protein
MANNPTGPISADEMRALADAPYGKAAEELRKHDPFWGRGEGEIIKWRVDLSKHVTMIGHVVVEAASEKEAEALADAIPDEKVQWEPYDTYSESDGAFPL